MDQPALMNCRLGLVRGLVAAVLSLWGATVSGQAVSDPYRYSRTASFSYLPNGLLQVETIEPDLPQQCVTTVHAYDDYGNRVGSTTRNCGGAVGLSRFEDRIGDSTYGAQSLAISQVFINIPPGTFPTETRSALAATTSDPSSHTIARAHDPRFGVVTNMTGPDGLATSWQYDSLGRVETEVRPDGTRTVMAYCWLATGADGGPLDTSSNSLRCSSLAPPAAGEVPPGAVRFEQRDLLNANFVAIGPFSRSYFDAAGRVLRTVTEAFDGPLQPSGARLIVQDSVYDAFGALVTRSQPYFLQSRSSTSAGSNDFGVSQTVFDALGRPTVIYAADADGSEVRDFGGAFGGSRRASKSTVEYAGLATTTRAFLCVKAEPPAKRLRASARAQACRAEES